jgi:5-methylcytosine-specific restriction endonuclease McrA
VIRLVRLPVPAQLRAWLEERANTLRELLQAGQDPPKALLASYRHPPVKAHLVAEAHGKCIYCESKIPHVYFGDVEHIKPKSVFPTEQLDFENLGLACAQCNNAKDNFWDVEIPFLNPYQEDPGEELLALGFMIAHRPGHPRAKLTIAHIGLNRPELLERRKERIELLQPLADQYEVTPDGALKDLLRTELRRHGAGDSEYAMIVRTYLEAACKLQHDPAA